MGVAAFAGDHVGGRGVKAAVECQSALTGPEVTDDAFDFPRGENSSPWVFRERPDGAWLERSSGGNDRHPRPRHRGSVHGGPNPQARRSRRARRPHPAAGPSA